jgi:hypothetical protein
MVKHLIFIVVFLCTLIPVSAQDTITKAITVSKKYVDVINSMASDLNRKLDRKTQKVLRQFKKSESKLKAKLSATDSIAAANLFAGTEQQYKELEQRLNGSGNMYIAEIDSLTISLKFLQANPGFLQEAREVKAKLQEATKKLEALKSGFANAEAVKQFLRQRRDYLKDQLSKFGFGREFKKLNKQVYYYSAQLSEYKAALKDPKKASKKALELLAKNKSFREFWRKNSQLASLFRLPGEPGDPGSQANLAGLQTRAQVNGLIQQQLAAGGPNAQAQFQQNMQAAQSQLNQLKDKVIKMGGGSSDTEMPEGFRPQSQKTKSFFQRLALGTNIQSVRSNGILPTTSDLAISAGYKLNDKSVIGLGASYKLGLGKNIQNIRISHQGVGARSYVDWKLKGSLWISGGFEMNYRTEFRNFAELKDYSAWQQSGLIGLQKKFPVKSKLFRESGISLLWDFMSYQQVPRTQAVLIRFGYGIK